MRTFPVMAGILGLLVAAVVATARVAPDERIASIDVLGTSFHVETTTGRKLGSEALVGAVLSVVPAGAEAIAAVRIDRVERDQRFPDILLHEMSVFDGATGLWVPMCEADAQGARWAFPLAGQWDESGTRRSDAGLTLACAAGGAIGKCVMWGYRPWSRTATGVVLAPFHQACIRMVRADYCGDGRGTTKDGVTIDIYDGIGVNAPSEPEAAAKGLSFEAAWAETGALCVAHTRVPENLSNEALGRMCPGLRERIGTENCLEGKAREGYYGQVKLLNAS